MDKNLEKAMHMFLFGEAEKARESLRAVDPGARADNPFAEAAWWLPGWGALVAQEAPELFRRTPVSGFAWLGVDSLLPFAAKHPMAPGCAQDVWGMAQDGRWPTGENAEICADWFPGETARLALETFRGFDRDPELADFERALAFLGLAGVEPEADFLEQLEEARQEAAPAAKPKM